MALFLVVSEAAAFTVGCALIHTQRRHAERITDLLLVMLFAGSMVLALDWGLEGAFTAASAVDLSAAFTGISE